MLLSYRERYICDVMPIDDLLSEVAHPAVLLAHVCQMAIP